MPSICQNSLLTGLVQIQFQVKLGTIITRKRLYAESFR